MSAPVEHDPFYGARPLKRVIQREYAAIHTDNAVKPPNTIE
jgi:C-terminal, D2-small domain, of ClpB protein